MSRLRVALVGAGSMGSNHARVIAQSSEADLVRIVDPRGEAAEPLAVGYGAEWRPELDDLAGVDAVVVAASTEHHYGIVSRVLSAGVPVLVEKPICPSLAQTEEILALSAEGDVPIMCGFLERFNPAVLVARGMIDQPVYVRAERFSPYAPRIRTGVGWDLLVHDVDLIAQLFGQRDIPSINVEVGHFHPLSAEGAEDVVDVSLAFDGGGLASASASRLSQRKIRTMVIQTLDSMVEIDLLRRGVTLYRHTTIDADRPGGAGFRQVTEMEVPEITGREPLVAQFDRFVELARGEVDAATERQSILPAHRIVDRALAASAG